MTINIKESWTLRTENLQKAIWLLKKLLKKKLLVKCSPLFILFFHKHKIVVVSKICPGSSDSYI